MQKGGIFAEQKLAITDSKDNSKHSVKLTGIFCKKG
jgi:hypothetical protein